ncbi:hypothetical protein J1N35_029530 [Gossypium stocksii]|uniref:Nudix hydrolase domain-containing protein n=1 Tax=Gossypium stocksii TaxID=47602 RepID=A0A9D3UY77_9ROSI|nr:hypothetical protein J1N35_029530 [Gossypium stocksii]
MANSFPTPQALLHWLKPRLPSDTVTLWGTKPATKNVHNLWLQLALGESTLFNTTPPLYLVEIICVTIINNKRKLHGSRQLLSDGTMQPCGAPLSRRMRAGESPEVAAHRAIQEELASVLKVDDVKEKVRIVEGTCKRKVYETQSRAYPGLRSRCVMHTVDAYVEGLPERNFSTEAEEFGDCNDELKGAAEKALRVKRNFWVWRWGEQGSSAAFSGLIVRTPNVDPYLYSGQYEDLNALL